MIWWKFWKKKKRPPWQFTGFSFRQGVKHLVRPQATQESRKNIADYGSSKTKNKGLEIGACVGHVCISLCVSMYGRVSVCICVAMCVYIHQCMCSWGDCMTEWHTWAHVTNTVFISYMYVSCFLQQRVYIPAETSFLFPSITLTSRKKVSLIHIRLIIFQGRKTRTCPTQL